MSVTVQSSVGDKSQLFADIRHKLVSLLSDVPPENGLKHPLLAKCQIGKSSIEYNGGEFVAKIISETILERLLGIYADVRTFLTETDQEDVRTYLEKHLSYDAQAKKVTYTGGPFTIMY